MPLPKRKRIFTPKRKTKHSILKEQAKMTTMIENKVTMARGLLKGALMDALDPLADESDVSFENTPSKRERKGSDEQSSNSSAEEDVIPKSPPRQSYVLKLFDRSVDLSQFTEDSPLYPICRAWIANKPKANYSEIGKYNEPPETIDDGISLPPPEGPPVSRIPQLTPAQRERNKHKINLNYREAPPPSRETLLRAHLARWADVRGAWLERGALVEARYAASQRLLNDLNISGP